MNDAPAAGRLAAVLERARSAGEALGPDVADQCSAASFALTVQQAAADLRAADGDRVIGWKAALTSAGSQAWLGATAPTYGRLFSSSRLTGAALATLPLIAPAIEPECLFVLGRDLGGPDCGRAEVLVATRAVVPALEVADCRVADWQVTLPVFVADNAAAGWFLASESEVPLDRLEDVTVRLELNGEPCGEGAAANVLGHPADAVAWMVRALHEEGRRLRAGDVVMSGSLSAPVRLSPGDRLTARFGAGQTLSVTW